MISPTKLKSVTSATHTIILKAEIVKQKLITFWNCASLEYLKKKSHLATGRTSANFVCVRNTGKSVLLESEESRTCKVAIRIDLGQQITCLFFSLWKITL